MKVIDGSNRNGIAENGVFVSRNDGVFICPGVIRVRLGLKETERAARRVALVRNDDVVSRMELRSISAVPEYRVIGTFLARFVSDDDIVAVDDVEGRAAETVTVAALNANGGTRPRGREGVDIVVLHEKAVYVVMRVTDKVAV